MIPSFLRVIIDGKPLDEVSPGAILASLEVTQELNDHWWCRLEVRQTEDRRFPFESCLGKSLRVGARDQEGRETGLFFGFLLEAALEYEISGSYTARLTGVTRSYRLQVTPQQAYFRKKTLEEVARQLVADDKLTVDVQAPSRPPKNYVQWGETDFDFLKRLADDYDCWIRPSPKGIQILDQFQPGTELQWRTEEGLLRFEMRGRLRPPSVNGTHYNPRKMSSKSYRRVGKPAEFFSSSRPLVEAVKRESQRRLPPGFVYWDTRAATPSEYEAMLQKESGRSVGSGVVGWGVSRNHKLRAGNLVTIEGLLDARGEYGVTKVIHRWLKEKGGYENEFWCTPWKNWASADQPKPKTIAGVASARVVDHNDRRKMGRVKVRFPWLTDGETSWARMATPSAGPNRGFMFMPEKGDEVLVAFEQGDPERPMVLGALWNGVQGAPRDAFWPHLGATPVTVSNPGVIEIPNDVANNDVKRIRTRSGNIIEFVDTDTHRAIVVSTAGGQTVKMIDNCAETKGRPMICLTTPGDILLHAPTGRVHICSRYFSREVGALTAGATADGMDMED